MPSSIELKDELYEALSNNEFILYYEPQLDLKTQTITGVEALLRWNHPQHGLLRPVAFLASAEESGLIIPIGEWVMREACLANKRWQEKGYSPISIAINISPKQFHSFQLLDVIKKTLIDTKL
ncbi:MAG TPA: EAL domain-containing protein, partial [Gammaproteobacteria bacterium]|nr:EAL domain-containing protein [Gammaproteobacteria bacterium]